MSSLIRVIKAVASSMVGIGKRKRLAQDFEAVEKTGPWLYIVVGLVMTVLFIGTLVVAVRLVLP
mgnify:CR=1 FL=1